VLTTQRLASISTPKSVVHHFVQDKVFQLLICRQEVHSDRLHSYPLFCSSAVEVQVSADLHIRHCIAVASAHTKLKRLVYQTLVLRLMSLALVAAY
jgi:hypothetical protein